MLAAARRARRPASPELPESLRRLVSGQLGSVLRLRGLDEEDLRDLAAEHGRRRRSGCRGRARLRYGTQGNPLHARALLEEFPPTGWGPSEQPLPPPRSFRRLVQDRYAACAAATRRLIDAAAVLGPHCPLPLGGRAGRGRASRCRPSTRRPGATCCSVVRGRVAVDAVVPAPAGPGRGLRRARARPAGTRCTLAAAGLRRPTRPPRCGTGSPPRPSPDEQLADDLTRFADAEARRQAWQSAAAHLVEASRLSPDPDEAQRRVLRAVVWTLLRGDAATAASFAARSRRFAAGPLRDVVLGSLAMAADDPATAERLLTAPGAGARPGRRSRGGRPTIALMTGDPLVRPAGRRGHRRVVRAGAGG